MITGINHITLSVDDLDESFAFYTEGLGFKPVARWPTGAYVLAGDVWLALIVDTHVREAPLPEYTHIAFAVAPEAFEPMCARLRQAGAKVWQENQTEGASFYFLDPDGHKFEIHASDLAARLRTAKEKPWDGLEFFV